MKSSNGPESWQKCSFCHRRLADHIRDIQAGLVKAHTFKGKKGKK